ncbi:MAG: sulfate ABC transporter permease subunit CysT [Armatimonadetes bacterium]|nr:sulfate ABC transporter permease subunit CysT [Armatimonadota bacterium]
MSIALQQPTLAVRKPRRVLPGFGLSLGYSLLYLGLIVMIPLAAVFVKSARVGGHAFWQIITDPRTVAAFRLSFGASFAAALVNAVFGLLVAWVLVRYSFPGRRVVDGLVDLPFALPTAVAGITLAALFSAHGWLGHWLEPHGIKVANSPLGVFVALTFIGLPFVVRTVQPVLQDMDDEVEEAAASLGASRGQTFLKVLLPTLLPATLTGFTLAFARALGEYGSVIFISNNLPFKGEIVALLIVQKLEEFDYAGASAVAVVMLTISFGMLLLINVLQWASRRRLGEL